MQKIFFKFNKQKAVEAVLHVINKRPSMDKMSLFKFLFFADVKHLNEFGRPIFGGHYVAMNFGPVPSQISNLIDKNKISDVDVLDYMLTAKRNANLEILSQSDVQCLDEIYCKYQNYTSRELSDLSHEHPAWKNARQKNIFRGNNPLDYKDMIDEANVDILEDLLENSRYILI